MSRVRSAREREYTRICRMQPDEATVRREYKIADAKFREAVSEGNGSTESGAIIAERVGSRDAWAMYAEERGIKL